MALEIPCPQCQSILRAPEEAIGKRVRCKKCNHRFHVPSDEIVLDVLADSQMLSAIDSPVVVPPAQPAPVVPKPAANPAPDDLGLVEEPGAAAAPVVISGAAAASSNPFSFDGGSGPAPILAGTDDAAPPSPSKSRRRHAGHGDKAPAHDDKGPKKSGRKMILILGSLAAVMFFGCAGGVGAIAYYFGKTQQVAQAPPSAKADAARGVADAGKAKDKGKDKAKDKAEGKADAKGKDLAKSEPLSTDAASPPAPGPEKPAARQMKPAAMKAGAVATPAPAAPAAPVVFALPAPPTGAVQPVAREKVKIVMEAPVAAVRSVRFAHGAVPVAAVLWKSTPAFQGAGAIDTVDVYSTATKNRAERVTFPADGVTGDRLFDISPDGSRIVLELPAGKLTVYEFDKKVKPLDGIDPFAGVAGRSGPAVAARFISPTRLAVIDRAGTVDVWDVGTKARVVTGTPAGAADPKAAAAVAGAVAGGTVPVGSRGEVLQVDVDKGAARPGIAADPMNKAVLAVAADPTGKRLAAAYSGSAPGTSSLVVVDPSNPDGRISVPLPTAAGEPVDVTFAGPELVVVYVGVGRSGAILYDTEARVACAYLRTASGGDAAQYADPVDGQLWWIVPDPANAKKSFLCGTSADFDGYQGVVEQAKADKKPVFLVVRPDGLAK
ncbi:MJ0042-type zinc finger domain-containing protein [Fimbriiglobus ruber]|uniref:Putative Fe-S oxidoreductase n=1 Tax=Fimbriiglobus ruber TaxID=1908690 RepID=A0A225DHF9_9BACT|nr:MJ0042-type zinc finger domain-containing protein [Fimbriiglobus ruber]OWK40433.1 putative Fe-S oxidoreductase [Fimbriiglobus ruber]